MIALCIGHSRYIKGRRDGGAVSVGYTAKTSGMDVQASERVSEWQYNRVLANHIQAHLERFQRQVMIVDQYQGDGYGAAMKWLAGHLKANKVEVAIELHFNSAGPTARGHEWLYWHSSAKSRELAKATEIEMTLQIAPDELPNRGVKPISAKDRGSDFLRLTHCPALIAEPFFGSNADDWKIATERKDKIALAIACGVDEWLD